jgi:formylglycine-generating enzyme required for sulfatase activity
MEKRPAEGTCPPGAANAGMGPDMVRLPEGFCIDKTEVTRGQYEAWLDSKPSTSGQSASCSTNTDFTPSCDWKPGANKTEHPVVCVDWCDAQAFCKAAGKRLCGKVGDGGSYPFTSYDDPKVSEWDAACTSGGQFEYTYGNTFDTNICRDADADDYTTWGLDDVGSFAQCHSPDPAYAEVFDLSGHVAEWDNSCIDDSAESPCRIRGGSFQHHAQGTRCAMGRELEWPRSRQVEAVGFRCCAD